MHSAMSNDSNKQTGGIQKAAALLIHINDEK